MGKGSKRRPEDPTAIAANWPWKPPILKVWDPATDETHDIFVDPQPTLEFPNPQHVTVGGYNGFCKKPPQDPARASDIPTI